MTERTQILIEAVPSRFWEFSSFKPPAPQLMNLPRVVSLAISRLPWLLPSREICGSTGCIVCRTHGRCFGKRTIPPQRYRSQCEGADQTSLIELCTAHRLVFAFIADLGLVDAALCRNLCDIQDYPPTGIPAADFSGHLGEATIARLLGFIG